MKSFNYYLTEANDNLKEQTYNTGNREVLTSPLIVNCAGRGSTDQSITNAVPKGRLDYHLIYIISGELNVLCANEYITLGAGSIIVFPAKQGYEYANFGQQELNYLWVHFTGSQALSILNRYGIALFPKTHRVNTNNSISHRFQKLFECFAKNDRYREDDLSASLYRLLIEVGRAIEREQSDKISLSKSIQYINEFYTSKIRITDLAKMENMCSTTYNLHFKRQMEMSPTKYIIKLRMQSAKELLEASNLSIKEISAICGYDDFNFFSRVFKENIGISPTAYKLKINAD